MKSIQNSLTETNSAFRPTRESMKIHDNENKISCEVVIIGLIEEKGTFHFSFEADSSKLQNVCNHMDETTFKIDSTRRIGQPKNHA